jgi:hypothetical protein
MNEESYKQGCGNYNDNGNFIGASDVYVCQNYQGKNSLQP